jgi:hypothetical protein
MTNPIQSTPSSPTSATSRSGPAQQDQPAQPEVASRTSRVAVRGDQAPPELARRNTPPRLQTNATVVLPGLEILPSSIQEKIFENLPPKDLGRLAQVSTAIRKATTIPLQPARISRAAEAAAAAAANRILNEPRLRTLAPEQAIEAIGDRIVRSSDLPDEQRLRVFASMTQDLAVFRREDWHLMASANLAIHIQGLNLPRAQLLPVLLEAQR